jgi:hypothetical protein
MPISRKKAKKGRSLGSHADILPKINVSQAIDPDQTKIGKNRTAFLFTVLRDGDGFARW